MVEELKESRETRIARYLSRQAAGYDDPCFQMFIWYFLPDGSWDIAISKNTMYHADFWRQEVRAKMAHAWGIDISNIPTNFDQSWIPSGYIDYYNAGIRDIMVLIGPTVYPDGWSEDRLKGALECGDKPMRSEPRSGYNTDPDTVRAYFQMFERIREGGSGA